MDIILLTILVLVALQTTYILLLLLSRSTNRSKKTRIFIDTSVLIDGRVLEIARSGFIPGVMVVPRSVINELQLLADQADHEKRTRARHGLDILSKLQAIEEVDVELLSDHPSRQGVDRSLLELAKRYRGIICTIDFNLIKVADVEGVKVLNINDLARNLRMAFLPGEQTSIELTQKGNDSHQAVGYLSDGTMVVVEQANNLVGRTVEVEFVRSLQTAAGRMMFAKLVHQEKTHTFNTASKSVARSKTGRKPVSKRPNATHQKPSVRSKKTSEDRLVELANR